MYTRIRCVYSICVDDYHEHWCADDDTVADDDDDDGFTLFIITIVMPFAMVRMNERMIARSQLRSYGAYVRPR